MAQLARDEAGNVWELDEQGNAVRLVQPAQSRAPIAPPNPVQQFEPQKAQADARRAQAEADLAQAQTPYAADIARAEVQKALAEAEKARAEANRDPNAQVLDRGKIGQFIGLEAQIERIKELYRQGPGATGGIGGLADYMPSDINAAFDSAGAGLSEVGLAAFRVPGVGSQSDAELRQFVMANTPSASDRDSAIEEKIGNLERRLRSVKQAWGVDPDVPATQLLQQFDDAPTSPNAMDTIRTGAVGQQGQAVPLSDTGAPLSRVRYDPLVDSAHDQLINRLLAANGGRLPPEQYAQGVAGILQEAGVSFPADQPAKWSQWAGAINSYLDAGGRTIPTQFGINEVMSARDTAANNLINNPVGGALAGSANMMSLGAVEAMAPAQYEALRDTQGIPTLAGEIAGGIGATSAIGRAGRAIAGRVAPGLLGGGGQGQFLRNVATDAAFGGAYGGIAQDDPLTGAVLGSGGSALGQGAARGLGALVGGAQRTAAAQALRDRGVPVSVARQMGLGRVEDVMQSVPIVGDVSRARQMESFEGFNRAAMEEAGRPIGFVPTQTGAAGVDDFGAAVSNAYRSAVQGVTAPLDRAFLRDMVPVRRLGAQLSPTNRAQLAETLKDAVQLPADAGAITPEQFQDAVSALKALRSNAKGVMPNSAQTLRKAATQTINALEGAMKRAGGQSVIDDLNAANAANRGFKTIEDAALNRANVGTQAGQTNVFTPAQLLQSARQAERRGFGNNPLMELGRQGQEVLPSTVPNSGTTDRMLAVQALGGIGALGGGAGFLNDQTAQGAAQGTATAAGTAATVGGIAALLGTRRGQQVLEQILMSRPQGLQAVGQGFRRRSGLFGSAGGVAAQNYGY